MKVFISWSGDKSKAVAQALHDWLPSVIQEAEPFMSSKDIEPGVRWPTEIPRRLENTTYGIICVTHDNQRNQWLNFEAGALAKAVDESRVVPLAIDLKPSDIEPPLGHFQAQEATEDGIRTIVRAINTACEQSLEDVRVEKVFAKWWPDLSSKFQAIEEGTPGPAGDTRKDRELLEETLDIVRGLARQADTEPDNLADMYIFGPEDGTVLRDEAERHAATFGVGAPVRHGHFGDGVVMGIEPGGIVRVRFLTDNSTRKLLAIRAPLSLSE